MKDSPSAPTHACALAAAIIVLLMLVPLVNAQVVLQAVGPALDTGRKERVQSLRSSPDSKKLLASSCKLWDIQTRRYIGEIYVGSIAPVPGKPTAASTSVFSADSKTIFVLSAILAQNWDAATARMIGRPVPLVRIA